MNEESGKNKPTALIAVRVLFWSIAYPVVGALVGMGVSLWLLSQSTGASDSSGQFTALVLVISSGVGAAFFLLLSPIAIVISASENRFLNRWPNLIWMPSLVLLYFLGVQLYLLVEGARLRADSLKPDHRYHIVYINQRDEIVPGVKFKVDNPDVGAQDRQTDGNGYVSFSKKKISNDPEVYYEDGTSSSEAIHVPVSSGHTTNFVAFSSGESPGSGCNTRSAVKRELSPTNPVALRLRQKHLPVGSEFDTFSVMRGWQFSSDDLAVDELRYSYELKDSEVSGQMHHYELAMLANDGRVTRYREDGTIINPSDKIFSSPLAIATSCKDTLDESGVCNISVSATAGVAPNDGFMFRAPDTGWQEKVHHSGLRRNTRACGFFRVGEGQAFRYGAYAIFRKSLKDGDLHVWVRLNTSGGQGLLAPAELAPYLTLENSEEYWVAMMYEQDLNEWLVRMKEQDPNYSVSEEGLRNIFFPNIY